MQLLNGSRRSGKTLGLIKYVGEKELIIVCHNQGSCNYVKALAKEHNINLKYEPITIKRYVNLISDKFYIGKDNKLTKDIGGKPYYGGFVCDNLESCLAELGLNFTLATGTIPTTHPSNMILYSETKKQIEHNNLVNNILGEFKYE